VSLKRDGPQRGGGPDGATGDGWQRRRQCHPLVAPHTLLLYLSFASFWLVRLLRFSCCPGCGSTPRALRLAARLFQGWGEGGCGEARGAGRGECMGGSGETGKGQPP
jgi:hypothetical protein